ncbi:MAG: response regulator transcription factor [Patescibacteria group bacterium]
MEAQKNTGNHKKILIVDDDVFLLDMYTIKFREAGFEVDFATEGQSAKEKMIKNHYDVILLDIVMPNLDGFSLLKDLQQEKDEMKKTVIIYLTNLGQKEDIEKGLSFGVDDYIIKAHFTPSEVVAKVEELLKKKLT